MLLILLQTEVINGDIASLRDVCQNNSATDSSGATGDGGSLAFEQIPGGQGGHCERSERENKRGQGIGQRGGLEE